MKELLIVWLLFHLCLSVRNLRLYIVPGTIYFRIYFNISLARVVEFYSVACVREHALVLGGRLAFSPGG